MAAFFLSITGNCATTLTCGTMDFYETKSQNLVAAGKLVNGPDAPENPGNEDIAFGATLVPEPGTGLLHRLGRLSLGRAGQQR